MRSSERGQASSRIKSSPNAPLQIHHKKHIPASPTAHATHQLLAACYHFYPPSAAATAALYPCSLLLLLTFRLMFMKASELARRPLNVLPSLSSMSIGLFTAVRSSDSGSMVAFISLIFMAFESCFEWISFRAEKP
jgi:hypothetical protein